MPAQQGIVTILNDPNNGAIPDQRWVVDLAGLSPAPHHLILRASISVDKNNKVNIDSAKESLQLYKDAGFEVWLVLHGGLEEHYTSLKGAAYELTMPNAILGLNGDLLLNDYINKYSLTAVGTLQALGELCPATVFIWNEPNLDGPDLVQGALPKKGQSLSPEVFGAMLSTTAKRIATSCPNVTTILPGSLSCLVKFNTNPLGPWVAGYLSAALTYMNAHGTNAPYNFSGLSLNLEGIIGEKYANWCGQAVSNIIHTFNISGQSIIGEWGMPNNSILGVDMAPTFTALSNHFSTIFAYCHSTQIPNDPKGYGTTLWTEDWATDPTQGIIVPAAHTEWYDELKKLLATLNP